MPQRVMTAYGPGEVVESIRERGGTKHRVEGEGFSVWLTAEQLPEFGQLQWDEKEDRSWDNSTTLPYDPSPQFYLHDGYSTIQPGQAIDPKRRTSPADSVTFRDGGQPHRDLSHLFASREEELEDVQARLGDKYIPIPMDRTDTLQARLDDDPHRTVAELKWANYERRGELDPKLGQLWDLMDSNPEIRTSAWADIRKKAIRLRSSGNVQLEAANPSAIVATVTGDHGIYDVIVLRGNILTGSGAVTEWSCSCPWGDWAFDRTTYVGRLCSHAYAALLELQSLSKRKDKPYGWSDKMSARSVDEDDDGDLDVEAARYPREDGRLSTEPGTLTPDLNYIPYERRLDRIDVTADREAFLSEPFQGSGPDQPESFGTAEEYVREMDATGQHWHEDVDGPGNDPATENGDDVVASRRVDAYGTGQADEEAGILSGIAQEWGWEVSHTKDSWGGASSSSFVREGYVIGVSWNKPPAWGMKEAFLSTSKDWGMAWDRISDTTNAGVVRDWLQLSFLDDPADEYDHYASKGRDASTIEHDESGDIEHLDVEDPEDYTRTAATDDESRAWLMGGESSSEGGQFDFAAAAQAHLRTAGRQFTMAEQQALIDEEPVDGPLDQSELDLNGTHYLA